MNAVRGRRGVADIKIYTSSMSADCRKAKKYLDDEGFFYDEIDIDKSPEAARMVLSANGGKRVVPTFEIDGRVFSLKPFDWKRLASELEEEGIE